MKTENESGGSGATGQTVADAALASGKECACEPSGFCPICADSKIHQLALDVVEVGSENAKLRADLNEVLDALEDVSPYVFAFQHQKRASAKIQHAAAVLAKHRPATDSNAPSVDGLAGDVPNRRSPSEQK